MIIILINVWVWHYFILIQKHGNVYMTVLSNIEERNNFLFAKQATHMLTLHSIAHFRQPVAVELWELVQVYPVTLILVLLGFYTRVLKLLVWCHKRAWHLVIWIQKWYIPYKLAFNPSCNSNFWYLYPFFESLFILCWFLFA